MTKTPDERIPAVDLAAFIDGRLPEDERGRLEATLAADPEARAEMIAASRLVEQVEDQPVRRQRQ